MFYQIFVFLALILVTFADPTWEDKYSQPLSEKDMLLGKKIICFLFDLVFSYVLIFFVSQTQRYYWWAIYL
jgi:hypothetical protein